jgi:hypothetical protein
MVTTSPISERYGVPKDAVADPVYHRSGMRRRTTANAAHQRQAPLVFISPLTFINGTDQLSTDTKKPHAGESARGRSARRSAS